MSLRVSIASSTHYDSGWRFDYGNSSTNGRAVGTGTMETTYFGTSTVWGRGNGAGPWIMADMEAGLFSGYDAKQNVADPTHGRVDRMTEFVDADAFIVVAIDRQTQEIFLAEAGHPEPAGAATTMLALSSS